MSTIGPEGMKLVEAMLDHAADNSEPHHFRELCDALGVELDFGAFGLGMMAAAFIMKDINIVEFSQDYPDLVNKYIAKTRESAE